MNNLDVPAASTVSGLGVALSELRNNPSPETAAKMNKLLPVSRGAFYGSQILATQYAIILSTVKELNQANNFDARFEAAVLRQATDLEGDGELRMQEASIRAYVMY
ncbi:hypothetical protein SPFM10_00160 [Salmonella phage SPFM10]|nr:hypothetical protein SPFM10_00160 [Salmonella phage SPFM10]